eukprot:Hpha_TRINITY_DN15914_c0_g2::TRINITY_DN15914_c0_g2_i7::g.73095::m.73095
MGELQVFARLPEGELVAISCSSDAVVRNLMEEARQAAGLLSQPILRFLEVDLDPSMPVADTGLSSEAVVEVVPTGLSRVPIAAGLAHSMALTEDGAKVRVWGNNDEGQCIIPSFNDRKVVQVAAGGFHSMVLLEDQTICAWGGHRFRQCATPDFEGMKVLQISAGLNHSMALMEDHTVRAWGHNLYDQCTIPDFELKVIQIKAGYFHSMALMEDNTVRAWGLNDKGSGSIPPALAGFKAGFIAAGRQSCFAMQMEEEEGGSETVRGWGTLCIGTKAVY